MHSAYIPGCAAESLSCRESGGALAGSVPEEKPGGAQVQIVNITPGFVKRTFIQDIVITPTGAEF
jgi:hypothetical protein